jgi:rhodanese-related sulfurtransferase
MTVREIDVDELADRITAGATVIDVRQPEEYLAGHVPGSRLVPLNDVPDRLDELVGGGELLVICRTGARSMVACDYLVANGASALNVAGGTLAWVDAGRDVVEGEHPG